MKKIPFSKPRINYKKAVSILFMVLLACLYAYLYNRKFGVGLALTLIIAPFVSCLSVKRAVRECCGGISVTPVIASKSDTVDVIVTLRADSRFFIPYMQINIISDERLSRCDSDLDENGIVVTLSSNTPYMLNEVYRARMWGSAPIGISSIKAFDYFGLIEYTQEFETLSDIVYVRPSLIESQHNALADYLCNELIIDDKEDITSNKPSIAAQPGYTHRPYTPPDTLNHINWKLYARLDKLMVRETEYLRSQSPVIVLDPVSTQAEYLRGKALFQMRERVVEGLLAHVLSLVCGGLICEVYVMFNEKWQHFAIADGEELEALREALARFMFSDNSLINRLPSEAESGTVVFTCCPDTGLEGQLPAESHLVFPSEEGYISRMHCWVIDEAYDISPSVL